jgi:hypothetical protein
LHPPQFYGFIVWKGVRLVTDKIRRSMFYRNHLVLFMVIKEISKKEVHCNVFSQKSQMIYTKSFYQFCPKPLRRSILFKKNLPLP